MSELPFSRDELTQIVASCVGEVFSTMLGVEVAPNTGAQLRVSCFTSNMSGIVGFAGTYSGNTMLHLSDSFALEIAATMLGFGPDEDVPVDDIRDAVGEITNMVTGSLKSYFSKGGLDIKLSIPTVIAGAEYRVSDTDGDVNIFVEFGCNQHKFLVNLNIKTE